ncbi:MAG: hypothetical protein R3B06_30265 [Kofleriaceae bacterium]
MIDRTAAELAEEGHDGGGGITVLARKRQPKPVKVRPPRPDAPGDELDRSAAAEARRRRRRRRRKRRSMLPRRTDYTTPVLSVGQPPPNPGDGHNVTVLKASTPGGPVIEYVRGPMRINMAPVASAAPSDTAGAGGRRGGPRWDNRGRPVTAAERRAERRAERMEKRKRRRRRRKGNAQLAAGPDAPVSFFSPIGGPRPAAALPSPAAAPVIELGPDGQPLPRKRRRRRRRGRGGRGRPELRAGGDADGGDGGDGGDAPRPPAALVPPRSLPPGSDDGT